MDPAGPEGPDPPYKVATAPTPAMAAAQEPSASEMMMITTADTTMYGMTLSDGVAMTGDRRAG